MKVLIVTPYPTLPLSHGGRVRTYRLAAALRQTGAAVDILCPWYPGQPVRRFEREGVVCHPHFFCSSVVRFVLRERVVPSLVTLSYQPYWLGPHRRLRGFQGYDVVQFEFCAQASWMGREPTGAKVVYSAHNVEFDYVRAPASRRFGRERFTRRIETLERMAVRSSDMVVTCTKVDASRLEELYGLPSRAVVIPNGFDDTLLDFDRTSLRESARVALGIKPGDTAVLFVGGRAPHNLEGVEFLEREIVPRLESGTHLLLVGNGGSRGGRTTAGGSSIHRLGFMEDIRPVLAAADVGVNPVAYGSGSNLKMLEYLAVGLPVVTTPFGLRGFEKLSDGMLVAGREEFVEAIAARQPVPATIRGELVEFGWKRIGLRLKAAYEELMR